MFVKMLKTFALFCVKVYCLFMIAVKSLSWLVKPLATIIV